MNIYVSYLIVNIFRCYKVMQTECRTSSLLECFAEVQINLCKVTHYIYKVIEYMQKRTNNYVQSIAS